MWLKIDVLSIYSLLQERLFSSSGDRGRYEKVLVPAVGLFLLEISVLARYNIFKFPPTQMIFSSPQMIF